MNSIDPHRPDDPVKEELDFAAATRQLVRWIIERCAACAGFVFLVMGHMTDGPFPFGPDYRLATLVAAAATAMVFITLAVRAFLHVQRILADQAGETLSYWLGRGLRVKVLNRMSR